MAHSYLLRGGRVLTQLADKIAINIGFSFFVWDKAAKQVAFCFYAPPFENKVEKRMDDAISKGTDGFETVGMGRPVDHLTSFAQAIDLKKLTQAKASLSIAKVGDSYDIMTATIKLDAGHVILPFPVVAQLPSYFATNTRGSVFGDVRKWRDTPTVADLDKAVSTAKP